MKALQIDSYGGPESLIQRELPPPTAGDGQVVVRIFTTTLNPIDIKLASGVMRDFMPLKFPWTPGADFSGVIETVGANVELLNTGDEVYGYSAVGGAYAEQIVIDASNIGKKPPLLSTIEAASLALVGQTAQHALAAAKLEPGKKILIHGALGGVGSAAVQLAHAAGAYVIATVATGGEASAKAFGANEVIDYKTTAFETVVKNVDAVLDTIGGETQQKSFTVLKEGGVLVALTQPPSPETAAKYKVTAVMLDTHSTSESVDALSNSIISGDLKPQVGKVYPLADAAKVWSEWPTLHITGKIVFTVWA